MKPILRFERLPMNLQPVYNRHRHASSMTRKRMNHARRGLHSSHMVRQYYNSNLITIMMAISLELPLPRGLLVNSLQYSFTAALSPDYAYTCILLST